LQPAHRSLIISYMTLECNETHTKQSPFLPCISKHLANLGNTYKKVSESSDEDEQVVEGIDGEDIDEDVYSDEERAKLTNEEWGMLTAQELEIQYDDEDEDYNDNFDGLDDEHDNQFMQQTE
jgi:hypothetical protein